MHTFGSFPKILNSSGQYSGFFLLKTFRFNVEFYICRLQRELEACKECPEELACQHFRTELEELQKRCYHKEMSQHLPLQRSTGSKSTSTPNENNTAFRRSGHYNPYTHQYVPARKLFQSVAPSRPSLLHTSSGVSGLKGKKSGETSVDDSGFQDDSLDCEGDSELNLVDEEWLMEDSDINMELDERELALLEDNLHKVFIDIDDLPVDGDSDCRSRREVKKSQVPSSSGKCSIQFPFHVQVDMSELWYKSSYTWGQFGLYFRF